MHCTIIELVDGFRTGLFPPDGRNYSNETAMYICCRVCAAEAVSALAEAFDWFRDRSTVTTLDGRLPLHWLHAFQPGPVAAVAQLLQDNDVDIHSVDEHSIYNTM